MISGSEEESSITLPSPPTSSPNEFKSSGAFGIYLRSLPPSSPSDSRNFSDEAETLLPPLEVSHMTSVPANVLYLTCLPLYSDLYIKLHHLQHISSLAHNLLQQEVHANAWKIISGLSRYYLHKQHRLITFHEVIPSIFHYPQKNGRFASVRLANDLKVEWGITLLWSFHVQLFNRESTLVLAHTRSEKTLT